MSAFLCLIFLYPTNKSRNQDKSKGRKQMIKRLTQRVRRLSEGRKAKAVFAWATSWPMARQCFSLRPYALPLRSSALILCLFFFFRISISAPHGASHTFIASSTPQVPDISGRAGEAGIRPLRRRFRCAVLLRHLNASKVRQPRRTLNLFCPPANSMRSPSAWQHPAGLGAGVLLNPRFVFFFGKEVGLTPACNAAGPLCTSGRNKVRG